MNNNIISIQNVIGKGYADFWNFKGRYRICKGSRASKKSKTTALNFIYRIMKYPKANLIVVRKVYTTLKDSCYTELEWAIQRLNVAQYWECKKTPLEMTFKPTGQKIYFRGLDNPLKITSITVKTGVLCWLWIEEAYEILKEDDFNMLDESIRGEVPQDLFKQITITFNPWSEKHWLKKRFFDVDNDNDILTKTTNYMCNEFLDSADLNLFEKMKRNNPKRYKVAGLGHWGVSDGLIYENWEEKIFDVNEILKKENIKSAFGLDFGYTNDPTAFFAGLFDLNNMIIYVFDEIYQKAMTNKMIYAKIYEKGYSKEKIYADSAEPKSIDELRELGLINIRKARKGKDSINNGIQYIKGFKIYIHPKCVNFITEINNYIWDTDKFGNSINKPSDNFNHLLDALRYASEEFIKGDIFSFE